MSELFQKQLKLDGRLCLVIILGAYFIPILFGTIIQHNKNKFWKLGGVSAMWPPFIDAENITSGIDCSKTGHDVLIDDPCDVNHRPMNYPRIWLILGNIGFTGRSSTLLGLLIDFLFFATLILYAKPQTKGALIVWSLAMLSPAVMLGVERGNCDLVCVSLSIASIALAARHRFGYSTGFILLSAVLKLFPVFALLGLLIVCRAKAIRTGVFCLLSGLLLFATYCVATRSDISEIQSSVPHRTVLSYGYEVLPLSISSQLDRHSHISLAFFLFSLLLGVTAYLGGSKYGQRLDTIRLQDSMSYMAGSIAFIGTYYLGTNSMYRLVFLLLLFPFLIHQEETATSASARKVTKLTLAVTIVSLYIMRASDSRLGGLASSLVGLVTLAILAVIAFATGMVVLSINSDCEPILNSH